MRFNVQIRQLLALPIRSLPANLSFQLLLLLLFLIVGFNSFLHWLLFNGLFNWLFNSLLHNFLFNRLFDRLLNWFCWLNLNCCRFLVPFNPGAPLCPLMTQDRFPLEPSFTSSKFFLTSPLFLENDRIQHHHAS